MSNRLTAALERFFERYRYEVIGSLVAVILVAIAFIAVILYLASRR